MTQCDRILQYMEKHGSINQKQAMIYIGCYRLAARIADLRAAGYKITRQMVKGKNRYGEPVSFAEYRLEE